MKDIRRHAAFFIVLLLTITAFAGCLENDSSDDDIEETTDPVTIEITSPRNRAMVEGTVDIAVETQDGNLVVFSIGDESVQTSSKKTYTWDTTEYLNDDYVIKAEAVSGETTAEDDIRVTVFNRENEAPEVTISEESEEDTLLAGSVTLGFEFADTEGDPLSLYYQLDDEDWELVEIDFEEDEWSYQLDTTRLEDGEHVVRMKAADAERESEVYEHIFTVDNSAPELDLGTLPSLLSGEVTLTVEAQDANYVRSIAFFLDDEQLKNGSSSSLTFDSRDYLDGVHTLDVGVMDSLRNYQKRSKDLIIDNEGPDVYFLDFPYGSILNAPTTVNVGWHDLSDVEYFVIYLENEAVQESDETSWYFDPAYWVGEGTIEEGEEFQVKVVAEDVVGNTGEYAVNVKVDLTEPTIEFRSPGEDAVLAGENNIDIYANDAETGVIYIQYYIDDVLVEETSTNIAGIYSHLWDTTTYDDGDYELTATAIDSGSNERTVTRMVSVDNTMPDITINSPENGNLLRGDIDLEFTASDNRGIATILFYLDGEEEDSLAANGATEITDRFSLDTTGLEDGEHDLAVTVLDLAGNDLSTMITITIDNTPPEIRNFRPRDGGKVKEEAELSIDARDDNGIEGYWFYVDGEEVYSGGNDHCTIDTTDYEEGDHELRFVVEDRAGNSAEKQITFTVDNVNPLSLTITAPQDTGYVQGRVEIEVETEDKEGEVQYISFYIDDMNVKNDTDATYDWDTNKETNDWHELRVVCGDDKGYTAEDVIEVFVDNIDPWMDITTPDDGEIVSGVLTIEIDAEDHESGLDTIAFHIDGEEVQSSSSKTTFSWNTSTYSDGDHDIWVVVYDRAQNQDEEVITVTVDNTPPEIELVSPEKEYLGGDVNIRVDVTEEGSGVDYIEFKIKDETRQKSTQESYRWDTTKEEDGPEYNIEVEVADKAGNVVNVTKTVLVDNTPPEVDFTKPVQDEAIAGDYLVETSITETGSGRDYARFYIDDELVKNSTATSYSWDTTSYADGEYEIKVEVADKAGNSGEKAIDVQIDNTIPSVSITSHSEGEKLEGDETFTASASDNAGGSGVWKVEFFFGGNFLREDVSEPYTADIDADSYPDGEYELLVIARDYARNLAQDSISLTIGDEATPVVSNPHTNFLSPYSGLTGVERLTFTDHRAVPVVTSLITTRGITPSVSWDGTENPKQSADISFTDYSRFSGNIALNYWTSPEKSIVVEGYAQALLMAPYAAMKDYPIFIYTKQYTDEAIWKMNTVYANQLVTCGNTGYNNKGVTVVDEDDVLQFTIDAAKSEGIDLEYISVANPDDVPAVSNTGYLSCFGAAFAAINNGALITVHANTNEINTEIHDVDALYAANDMTLEHIAIVGDHKSVPMINEGGTPSDNRYADFDNNKYTIERSIGRIFALELKDISYYFDRVFNYQDYWSLQPIPPGVRGSPYMLPPFWNDNAVIYCGVAAEFAEDSENHCREYMRFIGQFNTQDDSDKAHGAGGGPAIMQDFAMANFILINADHGYPSGTVTWHSSDLPEMHPGISFAVSCSLGRVDGQNKGSTVTYKMLEKGMNVYLAPTRTAYGSLVQTYPYQPIAAPGLCYLYVRFILDNDYDSGVAYMHAKNDLINNGYGGNVDQITTWQYQHYGDPAFNPYETNHEGLPW